MVKIHAPVLPAPGNTICKIWPGNIVLKIRQIKIRKKQPEFYLCLNGRMINAADVLNMQGEENY